MKKVNLKTPGYLTLIYIILNITFFTVEFMLVKNKDSNFIISSIFFIVSSTAIYLAAIYFERIEFKRFFPESAFIAIAIGYFGLSFTLSMVLDFIPRMTSLFKINSTIYFLLHFVLLMGTVIVAIFTIQGTDYINSQEEAVDTKRDFIKKLLSKLEMYRQDVCREGELEHDLDKLIEIIRFSNPTSRKDLEPLEDQITEVVDELVSQRENRERIQELLKKSEKLIKEREIKIRRG